MISSRSLFGELITLLVVLAASLGVAAERKEWVVLTNCQYVAHADNDGDSFRVGQGTNEFLFRLYFVDAPETTLRYPERTREQSEYFGVTLDETVRGGRTARDLVRETLRKPFTVRTRWASSPGRSIQTRHYALVMVGTNGLDETLVSKGLARLTGVRPNLPTGEKATAHLARLRALEAEAKQQRVGLWTGTPDRKPKRVRP